jgi:hypothetical protein
MTDRLAEFTTVILVGCFPVFPRLWKYLRGEDTDINRKYLHGKERRFIPFKTAEPDTSRKYREWSEVSLGTLPSSYIQLEGRGSTVKNSLPATESPDQPGHVSLAPTSQALIYKRTEIALEYGHQG